MSAQLSSSLRMTISLLLLGAGGSSTAFIADSAFMVSHPTLAMISMIVLGLTSIFAAVMISPEHPEGWRPSKDLALRRAHEKARRAMLDAYRDAPETMRPKKRDRNARGLTEEQIRFIQEDARRIERGEDVFPLDQDP